MITITYHFVAEEDEVDFPGGMIVSPQRLQTQLQHLLRHHEPVAPGALLRDGPRQGLPKNAFAIAFDDACAGHCRHVLPVLAALGLKAFFFVPTCIVEDRTLPIVEQQRFLQYHQTAYPAFYEAFCACVAAMFPGIPREVYEPREATIAAAKDYYAEYAFYSPLERLFRKVRETILTPAQFNGVIGRMFCERFVEGDIVQRFYLDWAEVREIHAQGHTIGGHGHRHLLEKQVAGDSADAARCLDLLQGRLAQPVEAYAYPYGYFSASTEACLRRRDIRVGFTCRAGLDMEGDLLRIDRLDCKAFPFEAEADPCQWSRQEASYAARSPRAGKAA